MIEPAALGLDHVPQVKMTPVRVGVEPLVGRGNGADPKAGAFHRVARVDAQQPFRRQPQLQRMVEDRLRQHERPPPARPPAARAKSPGRDGRNACGWRARDRLRAVHDLGWEPGSCGRAAGRWPAYFLRQVLREIKVDRRASPVRDLIKKPLCPSHQTTSEPAGGTVPAISSISCWPWRTGSIIA